VTTPVPHETVGLRAEHLARQLMARRTKVFALPESALRERLLAPRPARARVEVYVPPVGEVRPSAMGWGPTGPVESRPAAPRVTQDAAWAGSGSVATGSREGRAHQPVDVPAATSYGREAEVAEAWAGERLPAAIQDRLRPTMGHEVADVVVHTGDAATTWARGHGADAVTVGTDVYWAGGPPATDHAGDSELLRHEVWHAVQSTRPGTSWRRSTPAGREAEERQAGVHVHAVGLPTGLSPTMGYADAPAGNPSTPTRPQPAARTATRPAGTPPATTATPAAPAQQLMPGVRDPEPPDLPGQAAPPPRAVSPEAMYHEVLRQLRRDKERGA
jgi:hypothetical protein